MGMRNTGSWIPNAAPELYDSLTYSMVSACRRKNLEKISFEPGDHCSAFIATGTRLMEGLLWQYNRFTPYENSNYMNVVVDLAPAEGESLSHAVLPGLYP